MTTAPWPDGVLTHRPRVRVNQVGYATSGPKQATIITDAADPLPFDVLFADRSVAHSGVTTPLPECPDPSSGMAVHAAEFTDLTRAGVGFTVVADGSQSHPFSIGSNLYSAMCRDALRFFYLQRSGIDILDSMAPGYGRPAGHVGVPPNRGDTSVKAWSGPAADVLYPGWQQHGEFDVTGGWYDAGDHGKYVVNGGLAVAQLLAAHERGRRRCPDVSMSSDDVTVTLLEESRWELDWLLRMQIPSGESLAGMVFHRVHDVEWSPLPMWPHMDPFERVLHRPSTAATLNLAAAAAHGARLFIDVDGAYAHRLLAAARCAYRAAYEQPILLAPDDAGAHGGGPYNDAQIDDEFYWAATELYLTTGEGRFLEDLTRSDCHHTDVFDSSGFDWDRVAVPARFDLATVNSALPDRERIQQSVVEAANLLVTLQNTLPWGQPYAHADGWDWGSNGRILNNLLVIASAYDITQDPAYLSAAFAGMDYILGRNAHGLSYVTGYGSDFAHHQRTRHFARDLDPSFPPPPPGALAGGPNSKTYNGFPSDKRLQGLPPQLCYLDEPTSEVTNDVCIRWNSALVQMAMFLASDCSADVHGYVFPQVTDKHEPG